MKNSAKKILEILGKDSEDFLKKNLCLNSNVDFKCIATSLKRIKGRRLIYLAILLFGENKKSVNIIEEDVDYLIKQIKTTGNYIVYRDPHVYQELPNEIKKILMPRYISMTDIEKNSKFAIHIKINKKDYLVVGTDTLPLLDNIKIMTFPPYLMKKILSDRKNREVTKMVYSVRGDVTGVQYINEIEIRGDDVLRGFPKLIARLDVFKGIVSLFGPMIEVEYVDGLSIRYDGRVSFKIIRSLLDLLSLVSSKI